MRTIDTSGMSRNEWLALRRQSIGASDAPVIAGLSTYKTRFGLWLEKTGHAEDDPAGEQARWGTRLEDDILEELECQGVDITDWRTQIMVASESTPWMTATLDSVTPCNEIWEFKAVSFHSGVNLLDGVESTLPEQWILQAHHQMIVADADYVNFAVFVAHRLKLYRFVVGYDAAIAEGLVQLESEFWQRVESRTPPRDFDAADAAVLLKHYSRVNGETICLDEEKYGEAATIFRDSSRQLKLITTAQQKAKAELLGAMGEAQIATIGPHELRRSTVNVRASQPKPKAAYSYVRFTFSGLEED